MFQEKRIPAMAAMPGQQHQRETDAIRREVILDAQRRNPGDFDNGLEARPALARRVPASAMTKPSDRRQQRQRARARGRCPCGSSISTGRAEE